YSISEEGGLVRLDDELKHMRNYLFIQEQRFAGRIMVDLDIDESALASMLPKFTLQPVVENAFEHGLQRKEGAWRMQVRIRRIRSRIVVLVKDEGVGMTGEQLRRLREELSGRQREEEPQL